MLLACLMARHSKAVSCQDAAEAAVFILTLNPTSCLGFMLLIAFFRQNI